MKNQFIWFTLILSMLWLLCGCGKKNIENYGFHFNNIVLDENELTFDITCSGYKDFTTRLSPPQTYDLYLYLKEYYEEGENDDNGKLKIDELLGK